MHHGLEASVSGLFALCKSISVYELLQNRELLAENLVPLRNRLVTRISIPPHTAKNPNLTAEQAERSSTFEVDGDTMVQTLSSGLVVTYTRIE